ncbi:protease SohB [Congregibacter litoralis]|uniref:Putative serine peptidase n=1 Tax=Congregibacter litoralis KT71 TaxID=314285 RepID=A4A337_9GAMM|nr:protease SohB [Congregibacter litoralis]EAQ99114.1 putative serine peptidase [Congregibacter litoralis KT71]
MEFLSEYGIFLAKAITIVVSAGLIVLLIAAASQRHRGETNGHIEVHKLNDRYKDLRETLRDATLDPALRKESQKAEKKAEKRKAKEEAKAAKKQLKSGNEETPEQPRLYVLDFNGDIRASAVEELREEVSTLLGELRENDEVLLRLESGGGMVHSYGLASSQLQRIRNKGAKLTVAVDKVAASGGYMMACVANQIIAAPFAIIGSIGVIAQLPNFHRVLKKNDIDFEVLTAGEYKRTLTIFGENTDKGRDKFKEELEDTHVLFKQFVKENREVVDIDSVATGETWYGQRAKAVNLVDELQTSDEYIQDKLATHGVYELNYVPRKNWQQKLGIAAENALERSFLKLWQASLTRPKQ